MLVLCASTLSAQLEQTNEKKIQNIIELAESTGAQVWELKGIRWVMERAIKRNEAWGYGKYGTILRSRYNLKKRLDESAGSHNWVRILDEHLDANSTYHSPHYAAFLTWRQTNGVFGAEIEHRVYSQQFESFYINLSLITRTDAYHQSIITQISDYKSYNKTVDESRMQYYHSIKRNWWKDFHHKKGGELGQKAKYQEGHGDWFIQNVDKKTTELNIKSYTAIMEEDLLAHGGQVGDGSSVISWRFGGGSSDLPDLFASLKISYKTFDGRTIAKGGRLKDNTPVIWIDADKWLELDNLNRIWIIYHEAAHALFNIGHDAGLDLMFPIRPSGLTDTQFQLARIDLIDFILDADNPNRTKDWAKKYIK